MQSQSSSPGLTQQADGHREPFPFELKACYREAAAWNLYEIVKPAGGLRWTELSDEQKALYRGLVDDAVRATAKAGVQ